MLYWNALLRRYYDIMYFWLLLGNINAYIYFSCSLYFMAVITDNARD